MGTEGVKEVLQMKGPGCYRGPDLLPYAEKRA